MHRWVGFLSRVHNLRLEHWKDLPLELMLEARVSHVKAYLGYLKHHEGLGWNTISLHLTALRSFQDELLSTAGSNLLNPFRSQSVSLPRGAKRPGKPTQAMSDEQVELMLLQPDLNSRTGLRNRAILILFFYAGLRIGEVENLRVSDFNLDFDPGTLNLRETKAGHSVTIKLTDWVSEALSHWSRISGHTDHDSFFGISKKMIYKMFKNYLDKAGIVGRYSPHSARCTAINRLLDDGNNTGDIMRFSRHASRSALESYDRKRLNANAPMLEVIYGKKNR